MGTCNPVAAFVVELLIIIVGLIVMMVIKTQWPIFKRGFFCDDESLMHPYRSSTVPFWSVLFTGFLINFLAMICVVPVRLRRHGGLRHMSKDTLVFIFRSLWPSVVLLLTGFIIVTVLTDLPKAVIGRLRPHFISVCQPIYSGNCTLTRGYIENYTCLGKGATAHQLDDMRRSFPSGHSSSATFFAVAFMLYLQANMKQRHLVVLRSFIQAVVFVVAIYVCVSRISDYKHHWSDVLAGGLLGIFVPLVVKAFCREFDSEVNADDHSSVAINDGPRPM